MFKRIFDAQKLKCETQRIVTFTDIMGNSEGKLIKRKMKITPKLYEMDMQGVVYNGRYFQWFDQARFEIILELISIPEILETGLTFMIAKITVSIKTMSATEILCFYTPPIASILFIRDD